LKRILISLVVVLAMALPTSALVVLANNNQPEPNPPLTQSCGLDIVLVMDESSSIDNTEFGLMKAAFVGFVDALSSTPTEFALVDFGTVAYLRSGFTSDYAAIETLINNPKLPGSQYTNWQDALLEAHNLFLNRVNPDLIIFASDGNPNAYGDPATTNPNPSDPTTMAAALSAAISEANGIKSDGIRILTIGIGGGYGPLEELDTDNLIAVSSADALITTNFDDLAEDLANLATALCGGTITVHKIIDCDGDLETTDDQSDGGEWTFTAIVTPPGSSTPPSGQTDNDGLINFDIGFGGQCTATVSIVETLDPDSELLDATCTGATDNGAFDGTNSIDGIVIDSNDIVTCTFYNTIDCDDGNPCTIDTCDNGECIHTPKNCDDGNPCTIDTCEGGECVHTPKNCNDGNPCTIDTCVDGECIHTPKNCDDGDPCTIDTCEDGECVHTPKDCDDGNPCTIDTCVDGECIHTPAAPEATASSNSPVSQGATIQLYGGPDGMDEYNWTGPGGWTSSDRNPTRPNATTAMAGAYTLVVTSEYGCSDDATTNVVVTVPVTPAGGGGGGCPPPRHLTVDWEGNNTTKPLYSNGRLAVNLTGPSPDSAHNLFLERGTHAPVVDGKTYYLIVISQLEEIPPVPENTAAIVVFNITPNGAIFDRDIFLTLGLNQTQLPANVLNVTMAYYDDVNGVWAPLEFEAGGPNTVAELTLSAPINHFSIFGVLATLAPTPTPPAHFAASGLSIVPSVGKTIFVTETGESVTIAANVANDGGQSGTYTVELKLNGQTVDTRTVTLGAGQSQQVSFTRSGLDYGQYEVNVAGLSGTFTASRTITWWLIIVIIAAIGLIIWGVLWGARKRRKARQAAE
jgi:hypothetical protein